MTKARDPTRVSWTGMKYRCLNERHLYYANYGGRGISFCERWRSFENFLADMGRRPPGTSLDRIDNDRNYEPGNCRWATRLEQNRNRPGYNKLSLEAARDIAARIVRGQTRRSIAIVYGVNITTLRNVIMRRAWVDAQ